MTTTAITEHDLKLLKQQVGEHSLWPEAWNKGQWVPREDTMVFIVDGKSRAFLPAEDYKDMIRTKDGRLR